jgi:hypothetical protein
MAEEGSESMQMWMRRIAGAAFAAGLLSGVTMSGTAMAAETRAEEDADRRSAAERVAKSHDEALIIGAARLITKQLSLNLARELLAAWGKEAGAGPAWKEGVSEWADAEALLLQETVNAPMALLAQDTWVKEIRTEYVATTFAGEDSDTIANHFASESGKAQLAMMDWFMGETTLFNYTYSGRFKYDLKGAEAELKALQRAAQARIPEKDNELQFSTKHREAFQFVACSPESRYCVGPRYARLIAIPLQGAIIRHIDAVGAQIKAAMEMRREAVRPFIDAFRARS